MNKLLVLLLLLPAISRAQKLEISDAAGVSFITNKDNYGWPLRYWQSSDHGFTNEVSLRTAVFKRVNVGAFFQKASLPTRYIVGVMPEFCFSDAFYVGLHAGVLLNPKQVYGVVDPISGSAASTTFKPAMLYGIYAGVKAHFSRKLGIRIEASFDKASITETINYVSGIGPLSRDYKIAYSTLSFRVGPFFDIW